MRTLNELCPPRVFRDARENPIITKPYRRPLRAHRFPTRLVAVFVQPHGGTDVSILGDIGNAWGLVYGAVDRNGPLLDNVRNEAFFFVIVGTKEECVCRKGDRGESRHVGYIDNSGGLLIVCAPARCDLADLFAVLA